VILFKNDAVPDLAIVPILATTSSSFIPMPLSEIIILFSSLKILTSIFKSLVYFEIDLSSTDLNLNLSIASDAFETSSLIKISLFE